MEIKNAKITGTMLGREDHGIMTFMLYIEFGGCGCGVGGYALDSYDKVSQKKSLFGKEYGSNFSNT